MSYLARDAVTDRVDVFLIEAAVEPRLEQRLATVLTPAERARAARQRRPADRGRQVVARAMLRCLLGQRLGESPDTLDIVNDAAGKPRLGGRWLGCGVHFNVSHSGGRVALALAGTPVGVDIEHAPDPDAWPDAVALAAQWFEPEEAMRVVRDPAAFLPIWTAKEAVLKAWGDGLSSGMRGFLVPVGGSRPRRVLSVRPGRGTPALYVSALDAGGPYHAALAVCGSAARPALHHVRAADCLPAHVLC